jgi:hypothetical protein
MPRRRRWTPAEDQRLKDLWLDGLTYAEIGKVIKRTEVAVRQKIAKTRMTSRRAPDWPKEEEALIDDLCARFVADMLVRFPRSPAAMCKHIVAHIVSRKTLEKASALAERKKTHDAALPR